MWLGTGLVARSARHRGRASSEDRRDEAVRSASDGASPLSFPALGSCGTCYVSRNDLSGVKAAGLVLGNRTNQYSIGDNSLTLQGP